MLATSESTVDTSPKILAKPVLKTPPYPVETLLSGSGKEKLYPHTSLYLGSLIHGTVQAELRGGISVGNSPMMGFIEHLNKKREGLGDEIGESVQEISKEIIRQIKEEAGLDGQYQTEWFSEMQFEPSHMQVAIIERAIGDIDLNKAIVDMGFGSLNEYAKAAVTLEGFDQVLEERLNKLRTNYSSEEYRTCSSKLAAVTMAVRSYYYFDFERGKSRDFDLNAIPREYKKVILSAAARPDLIGLSVSKEDPDNESIKAMLGVFRNGLSGRNWGQRSLLDFSNVSREIIANQLKVLDMVRSGRIKMTFVEMKSEFSEERAQEASQTRSGGNGVPSNYIKDVAHTLWAGYQFLTRLYNLPETASLADQEHRRNLLGVMTADEDRRGQTLYQAVRFMEPLLREPHSYLLSRIQWPVINPIGKDFPPLYGLTATPAKCPFRVATTQIDKRELVRSIVRIPRRMVRNAIDAA
jgi:hypothetical protein